MTLTPVLVVNDGSGTTVPYDHPGTGWEAVGAYPFIDTADGAASYMGSPELASNYLLGARLSAFTPGPTLSVEVQIRFTFVGNNYPGFWILDAGMLPAPGAILDALLAEVTLGPLYQPGEEFVSGSFSLPVTPEMRAAAQRGDLMLMRPVYNPWLISQMNLRGSVRWLRGVQRNDGLSYTTPRGVQVSSVQRSLRGVGYR